MQIGDIIDSFGFGWFHLSLILGAGLIQIGNSMEMLLLSILGPTLQCVWFISPSQSATISTSVFFGMMLGAPIAGVGADRFGRRTILLMSSLGVVYFGFFSAFITSLIGIIVVRGCVGVCIGGAIATNVPLLIELTPKDFRAISSILMYTFWSVGAMAESVLAYFILPTMGWRWLLFVTAIIPLIAVAVAFFFIPESPRYYLLTQQVEKAERVLNKIAIGNRTMPYQGNISPPMDLTEENQNNLFDVFHSNYRLTFVMMSYLWCAVSFLYYGLILVITNLPNVANRCGMITSERISDKSCCNELTPNIYMGMIIATVGSFLSLPVVSLGVETLGRKGTLALLYFGLTILFLLKILCVPPFILNGIFFLGRMFTVATLCCVVLYTAEVFPTSIRNVAFGFCSSFGYISAMLTPYVAQVLMMRYSVLAALLIYASVAAIGGVVALLLPYETRNAQLQETVAVNPKSESEFAESSYLKSTSRVSTELEYSTIKRRQTL